MYKNIGEKLKSLDWKIILTHSLITFVLVFSVGISILFVSFVVVGSILGVARSAFLIMDAMILIVYPLAYWLGGKYASKYIKDNYTVKNKKELIIVSMLFLIIFAGGYRVYSFVVSGFMIESVAIILGFVALYFSNKKYLSN